jgi:hypothetical protein
LFGNWLIPDVEMIDIFCAAICCESEHIWQTELSGATENRKACSYGVKLKNIPK